MCKSCIELHELLVLCVELRVGCIYIKPVILSDSDSEFAIGQSKKTEVRFATQHKRMIRAPNKN